MRNDFLSHASDPDPDDSNQLQLEAGAALCALDAADRPLRSGDRVLSTHWFDLTERELRFLGLPARQAADLIEYQQIACIAPIGRADATSHFR